MDKWINAKVGRFVSDLDLKDGRKKMYEYAKELGWKISERVVEVNEERGVLFEIEEFVSPDELVEKHQLIIDIIKDMNFDLIQHVQDSVFDFGFSKNRDDDLELMVKDVVRNVEKFKDGDEEKLGIRISIAKYSFELFFEAMRGLDFERETPEVAKKIFFGGIGAWYKKIIGSA
jgi:hypothetical protein